MKQKTDAIAEIQLVPLKNKLVPIKHLSPTFYRQIATEEIILSPSGQFAGVPVGWLNTHNATCPNHAHYHILWLKGDSSLRQAVAYFDWEKKDPRYRKGRSQCLSYRGELGDLLALLLAPTHRFSIETGRIQEHQESPTIEPALAVSSHAALEPLTLLERARRELDRDRAAWEAWMTAWQDESTDPGQIVEREQEIQQARLLLEKLLASGVHLAHPALYKHMDDPHRFSDFNANCWEYALTDGYDEATLSREPEPPDEEGAPYNWDVDGIDYFRDDPYDPPLRWLIQRREGQHIDTPLVKMMTATHVRTLRLILAEQSAQFALRKTQMAALKLAASCDLIASRPQTDEHSPDRLPPLSLVRQMYTEAGQRLEAYTQQWKRSYDDLSPDKLEQLFLQ